MSEAHTPVESMPSSAKTEAQDVGRKLQAQVNSVQQEGSTGAEFAKPGNLGKDSYLNPDIARNIESVRQTSYNGTYSGIHRDIAVNEIQKE